MDASPRFTLGDMWQQIFGGIPPPVLICYRRSCVAHLSQSPIQSFLRTIENRIFSCDRPVLSCFELQAF